MVGREVGDIFPVIDHAHGDVVFAVENFSVNDPIVTGKKLVDNVSFAVQARRSAWDCRFDGRGSQRFADGDFWRSRRARFGQDQTRWPRIANYESC